MTEPSTPSQPPARRPNAGLIRAIVDYAGLADIGDHVAFGDIRLIKQSP